MQLTNFVAKLRELSLSMAHSSNVYDGRGGSETIGSTNKQVRIDALKFVSARALRWRTKQRCLQKVAFHGHIPLSVVFGVPFVQFCT